MKQTTLYYREGSSDKVYQSSIEPKDDGWVVHFAYGRRGSTLQTGMKTSAPVSLADAEKIHSRLVNEKMAKGYQPGEVGTPQVVPEGEGRDSGICCQLLNPVDDRDVPALLRDERWCLQEKFDGRRLMVRKQGGTFTGINRRGIVTGVPQSIVEAALEIPFDFLIDGEAVGDTLHAFDLLEIRGQDLRAKGYLPRLAGLIRWVGNGGAIRVVETATGFADKSALFTRLRKDGAEGVVLKDVNAAFAAGRTASDGSQLKKKFVESASFIVASANTKRSVALALLDANNHQVPAGNVTIPPNHPIPEAGEVVEVRYLYAFLESGAIYQPVYLGQRKDVAAEECRVSQLKFKNAAAA